MWAHLAQHVQKRQMDDNNGFLATGITNLCNK